MDILTQLGLSGLIGGGLFWFIKNWMKKVEKENELNRNDNGQNRIDITKIKDDMDLIKERIVNSTQIAVKEAMEKVTEVMNEMKAGIDVMNRNVHNMETIVQVFKAQVEEQNKTISARLDKKREWLEEVDEQLKDHEKRINITETTCKLNHKIK